MITLRPYQRQASDAIRMAMRQHRSVLYQAPTGSGKTALVAHIFHGLHMRGLGAWMLVHRRELVEQTSSALADAGVPHGIICPGYAEQSLRPIKIAMIQTLARRKNLTPPWLAVVDEAHHSVSATYQRVLSEIPSSHVLGVTATPERLDGQGLGDIYQHMILGPTVPELTAQGYLSPFRIWAPPGVSVSGVRTQGGDYVRAELARAADRAPITGDAIAHYRRLCSGKRAVAFCANVLHSQHVTEQFNAAGIPALHIDATTPDAERRKGMEDFRAGKILVMVNVDLFGEGVDVPAIEAAIFLRPTQSRALYLQQAGRALRMFPGKREAIILDHAGNVERHGFPDAAYPWTLNGRPRKAKVDEEPAIKIRVCPVCFAAVRVSVSVCPLGHVFAVKTVIPEISKGQLEELKREKIKSRRREESECRTLDDWYDLATERGNSPAWARIRYSLRN